MVQHVPIDIFLMCAVINGRGLAALRPEAADPPVVARHEPSVFLGQPGPFPRIEWLHFRLDVTVLPTDSDGQNVGAELHKAIAQRFFELDGRRVRW